LPQDEILAQLLLGRPLNQLSALQAAQIAAVKLGDLIENSSILTLGLLLAAMMITLVVGIIMPQAIAKWALLAPIFIPLFIQLGSDPATVLAAYRVADSPMNVVTPLMGYFPLIVIFCQQYVKDAGVGTVIAGIGETSPARRGAVHTSSMFSP
jgi:aminobenzoyl-glutamate transport protein